MTNSIKPTLLDRAIGYISPKWEAKRLAYREASASYRGTVPYRNGNWSGSSSNSVMIPNRNQQSSARDRARNLDRNSVLASSLLDRAVENVVGLHIAIEPTTDSDDFNEQAEVEWTRFKRDCDVTGRFSFDELTRIILRSKWRDGDVGVVLVDANGLPKLQIIEGDYIDSPPAKYLGGGRAINGIEIDISGRPVKYWIKSVDEKYQSNYTPVNSRDFIFLTNTLSASQYRGMTKFQQAFEWFNHIEGYAEGTVQASRAATLFSLLIKKNNPGGIVRNLPTMTNRAGEDQKYTTIEGGTVKYLGTDEDVVQVDPRHPTQSFPDAIQAFCRFIGLQFGLPIEQVLLDFSRANYTVSRAIKIQVQRTAEIEQQNAADQFVSRVYRWVISKAINEGRITARVPENYWKHEWISHPLQMVDEEKELAAAEKAITLGLDCRTYRARSIGYKFGDLIEQNQKDREAMEAAGLPLIEDKNAVPTGPAAVQQTKQATTNE